MLMSNSRQKFVDKDLLELQQDLKKNYNHSQLLVFARAYGISPYLNKEKLTFEIARENLLRATTKASMPPGGDSFEMQTFDARTTNKAVNKRKLLESTRRCSDKINRLTANINSSLERLEERRRELGQAVDRAAEGDPEDFEELLPEILDDCAKELEDINQYITNKSNQVNQETANKLARLEAFVDEIGKDQLFSEAEIIVDKTPSPQELAQIFNGSDESVSEQPRYSPEEVKEIIMEYYSPQEASEYQSLQEHVSPEQFQEAVTEYYSPQESESEFFPSVSEQEDFASQVSQPSDGSSIFEEAPQPSEEVIYEEASQPSEEVIYEEISQPSDGSSIFEEAPQPSEEFEEYSEVSAPSDDFVSAAFEDEVSQEQLLAEPDVDSVDEIFSKYYTSADQEYDTTASSASTADTGACTSDQDCENKQMLGLLGKRLPKQKVICVTKTSGTPECAYSAED